MSYPRETTPLGRLGLLLVLTGALALGLVPLTAQAQLRSAGAERIFVFEQDLAAAQSEGELEDIRWPVAVAAAGEDELAVADIYGPRLLIFPRAGIEWRLDRVLALSAPPAALVRDGDRYVLALRGERTLTSFEGADLLLRRIPLPAGVVPGALATRATASATAGDRSELLVYDIAGERVLTIAPDGGRGSGRPGGVPVDGRVTALAPAAGGGFYAAVAQSGEVRRYDSQGALDATWTLPVTGPVPPWPVALVAEPGGDLLAVDRHGHQLVVFAADGSLEGLGSRRGWEPGLLLYPAGAALLADGRYAVADQGNGRVQIFRRIDKGDG